MGATLLQRTGGRLRLELWTPPDNNFAALDGLRGFASVIVLTYHCAMFLGVFQARFAETGQFLLLRSLVNGFWSGIDIFFVLSGFLIGRILILDLLEYGRIRYRKFMLRRAFRIFPAYYLIVTLSLFVIGPLEISLFRALQQTRDWQGLFETAWHNYVYVSNYTLGHRDPNILSWGWSLCVEEHFYLLLPPLLWVIFRFCPDRLRLLALGCCVLLPCAGRGLQFALDPSIVIVKGFYYYSHNRFDEIFIGVVIAYLFVVHHETLQSVVRRLGPLVPIAGLLCVGSVWVFGGLQRSGAFSVVWQFIVMACGSGLLLLNGLFRRDPITRFFAHRAWYPLARISYGTYLVHPFVLFALLATYRHAGGRIAVGYGLFASLVPLVFVLASVVAAAMFILLERPLLDVGTRVSRRYA